MPNVFLLVAIGLFTGGVAGMLGAGGGFASVVLLIAVGAEAHTSVGSSLVYTLAIAAWGTVVHLRSGNADTRLGFLLGISSAVTAYIGADIGNSLSERALTLSFAFVMLAVGVVFLLKDRVARADPEQPVPAPPNGGGGVATSVRAGRFTAIALTGGGVIGMMKGIFGVGGGFMLVPFMVMGLGVRERIAVGTSLFAIVFGTIAGGIRHATLGNVDWGMVAAMTPGGLVGSYVGARLVLRMSPRAIRLSFVALVVTSAVYLILRSL